jgi:cell division protein FtsZ
MIQSGVRGVQYVAINTDTHSLARSQAPKGIGIGGRLTRGFGAGGNPSVGEKAAEESAELIAEQVRDADIVFIAAGMGGGTGTGAAPVIAQISKESGALVVGVVTQPFSFEGRQRQRNAEEGVVHLRERVDTLVAIPNDRLLQVVDRKTTLEQAFMQVDDVMRQGIQAISELIADPVLINLDFADVKSIMANAGAAQMAIGHGTGEQRAQDAARMAISSPLLDDGLTGANNVLLNITGSTDLSLSEISEAAEIVAQAASPRATIIFGAVIDPRLAHAVNITLLATYGRPPHGQLQAGPGQFEGGPRPPDSTPLGARLPRHPQAPNDHAAAAIPPPSPDPPDEPDSFPQIPRIRPRAPGS